MRILKLNAKTIVAFLLAGGFISDSASLPLVFSNLTNIVTVKYFNISFFDYTMDMFIPFIVSVSISLLFLFIILKKDIPDRVDINLLTKPSSVIKNRLLFYFSWIFISILLVGYFVGDIYHLPISIFALGGGLIFLFISAYFKSANIKYTITNTPWQVVWFSIGLYVVVYGLRNVGLTDYLTVAIKYLQSQGDVVAVVGTGFLSAFLSAFMNNMPTIMIMDISLAGLSNNENLIYANIIGSNIGPKMTPFGSLATLLWLHVLANKGVKIGFWEYSKFGLIITPPVLLVVLLSLFI
jgi:arsenical pump membrane protein